MISPPGEDTQDAQRWWQAYLLAENDQADERGMKWNWCACPPISETTTPGGSWRTGWPGCANAPAAATIMPGRFWPSGNADQEFPADRLINLVVD
jgi:hypothetical protein